MPKVSIDPLFSAALRAAGPMPTGSSILLVTRTAGGAISGEWLEARLVNAGADVSAAVPDQAQTAAGEDPTAESVATGQENVPDGSIGATGEDPSASASASAAVPDQAETATGEDPTATASGGGISGFTDNFTGANNSAPSSTHWLTVLPDATWASIYGNMFAFKWNHAFGTTGPQRVILPGKEDIAVTSTLSIQAVCGKESPYINGTSETDYYYHRFGFQNSAASNTTDNNKILLELKWRVDFDPYGVGGVTSLTTSILSYDATGVLTTTQLSVNNSPPSPASVTAKLIFTGVGTVAAYINGVKQGSDVTITATPGSAVKANFELLGASGGGCSVNDYGFDDVTVAP